MTRNRRILYVEDENDIREVATFALEDAFDLEVCTSGREALERATTCQPDLLLLDVMMPNMDGPTTLNKLREIPHLQKTPVIFMTAKVQPTEIEQFLSMGALGVIAKPFNAMTLSSQINQLLEGAS